MTEQTRKAIDLIAAYRKHSNMDAATYNYDGEEEVPQRLQLSPIFNAIWDEIQEWDTNVPYAYSGYSGCTGTHVMAILKALSNAGVIDLEQIKHDAVCFPKRKLLQSESALTLKKIDEICADYGPPEYVPTDDGEAWYWRFSGHEFPVGDNLSDILAFAADHPAK